MRALVKMEVHMKIKVEIGSVKFAIRPTDNVSVVIEGILEGFSVNGDVKEIPEKVADAIRSQLHENTNRQHNQAWFAEKEMRGKIDAIEALKNEGLF